MRVTAFTPSIARRLKSLCRRLGISDVFVERPSDVSIIAVLGNGALDAQALTAVCSSLNHNSIVALVKPSETRLAAVKYIRILSEQYRKAKSFLFIIDQERDELSSLKDELHSEVKKHFEVINGKWTDRWMKCTCRLGDKVLTLWLVINGLDEFSWRRHSIEDHMLKAAMSIGIRVEGDDPKVVWEALSEEDKHKVFARLIRSKSLVMEAFPQHVNALQSLIS